MSHLDLHSINPDSGQITIPKDVRDQFSTNTYHVFADTEQKCIVLKAVNVKKEGPAWDSDG